MVHILYHSTVTHEQTTHAVTHRKARDNSELKWVSWVRWGRKWCGREDRSPLRFTRFLPDSDTQKRTKQGCMYHRLYHRSWFTGRKTYARHVPQRVCATSPSVRPRGVFPGDLRVTESPRQPVGWPPESGQPVSLTGRPRGSGEIGLVTGTHGPPHPLPVRVGRWEGDCLSSGYRDGLHGGQSQRERRQHDGVEECVHGCNLSNFSPA